MANEKAYAEPNQVVEDHVMDEYELLNTPPIPPAQMAPKAETGDSDETTIIVTSKDEPKITAATSLLGEKGQGVWKVHIKTNKGHFGGGLAGRTGKAMELSELAQAVKKSTRQTEAFTPAHLETRFTPKTIIQPQILRRKPISESASPLSRAQAEVMREELFDFSYPWCTFGRVFVGTPPNFNSPLWTGSGVLVGKNLLLTASHVAPWGRSPWYMRFVPAYRNGRGPFGEAYVSDYRGIRNTSDVTGNDYVICRLFTPIGNQTGWMGSASSTNDAFYENGNWTSNGYPGNFFGGERPMVERSVRVVDVDNDGDGREIETNRFASPGWSGGPLWGWVNGQPKVVGIESGEETDFLQPRHNVFAGGKPMVDLVNFGLANWP